MGLPDSWVTSHAVNRFFSIVRCGLEDGGGLSRERADHVTDKCPRPTPVPASIASSTTPGRHGGRKENRWNGHTVARQGLNCRYMCKLCRRQ
jgi:hypothetical protein